MYEIGSEFNFIKPVKMQNLMNIYSSFDNTEFVRCGRDSIGLIAEDIKLKRNINQEEKVLAVIPALSCDSMVEPFRAHGYDIHFYPVMDDLSADESELGSILENSKEVYCAVVVLTMNRFGISDTVKLHEYIKEVSLEAVIVEDVTHLMLDPEKFDSVNADYFTGSIRKWLGVPDGAIAVCMEGAFTAKLRSGDTEFYSKRKEALELKSEYLESGEADLKKKFRGLLGEAEDSLDNGLNPYEITDYSLDYLSQIDLEQIKHSRMVNYHLLYEALLKSSCIGKYFTLLKQESWDNVPFMLPIVMNMDAFGREDFKRDDFERLLAAKGVYAPVLWPIEEDAAKKSPSAKHFSDNMLCFWIDQRYSRFDMEHTAYEFNKAIGEAT